ncbi:MAG: DUF1697 domain-containing protein [Rhodospirillales bacterium]|nr:DUF1697 domain-containing protein [Alphaproteobacteria bacterium]MCB9976141.1 DUF1697 domain-containing protein [Rhodospirillales bacterium]
MTVYVALLRAVNVGGTGKLPMSELKAMCEKEGHAKVQTYIASGNVVFESRKPASAVKAGLEKRLHAYAGKPVGAMIRTIGELENILKNSPFQDEPPNYTLVLFLDEKPGEADIENLKGHKDEQLKTGTREIYAYYPQGMGKSKLQIPAAKSGTGRNMNTVRKLLEIARNL